MSLKYTCKGHCFHIYKDRHSAKKSYFLFDFHLIRFQDIGAKHCTECNFYTFKAEGLTRCECCNIIFREKRVEDIHHRKNLLEREQRADKVLLNFFNLKELVYEYS